MKTLSFPLALIAALALCAFAAADITPLSIGADMPKADVKMKNIVTGKETSLKENKMDNGLLVIFSCNTCPFVVKQEAVTLENAKLAKEKKIGVVIINSNEAKRDGDDSEKAMKAYAKKQGFWFPYAVDANSQLADAFGATRTPEAFLFDKNLKLVYKGAYADDTDPANAKQFFLKDAIDSLAAGKTIDPNTTKSVGCTIKRK